MSKETGENVTKAEALANSIGEKEDKKSELAVMSKMKDIIKWLMLYRLLSRKK